jgi:hypothetical protein
VPTHLGAERLRGAAGALRAPRAPRAQAGAPRCHEQRRVARRGAALAKPRGGSLLLQYGVRDAACPISSG